jgi:hypothetical protein
MNNYLFNVKLYKMTGGILQLVSNNGHQDYFLLNEPQITHFKKIYRRNTQFSTEPINLYFSTPVELGQKAKCKLLKLGDLLHRLTLAVDLPAFEAQFQNLRSEDIAILIKNSILSDQVFYNQLSRSIDITQSTEVNYIIQLTQSKINCYLEEIDTRLVVFDEMESLLYPNELPVPITETTPVIIQEEIEQAGKVKTQKNRGKMDKSKNKSIPLPPTYPTPIYSYDQTTLENETQQIYNFHDFKYELSQLWVTQPLKEKYFLISNFLEYYYDIQNPLHEDRASYLVDDNPLLNNQNLANMMLYIEVFYNLVPSREILFLYFIAFKQFATTSSGVVVSLDSMIEALNTGLELYFGNVYKNLPTLLTLNDRFNSLISDQIKVENPDPLSLDSYYLMQQYAAKFNNNPGNITDLQALYYNYSLSYYYLLNSYNTVIKVVQSLSCSIPLIGCQALLKGSSNTDFLSVYLANGAVVVGQTSSDAMSPQGWQMFLDPNYRMDNQFKINNIETLTELDSNNIYYSDTIINNYLSLTTTQMNYSYNTIENNFNQILNYFNQVEVNPGSYFFNRVAYLIVNGTVQYGNFPYFGQYVTPLYGYQQNSPTDFPMPNNVYCVSTMFFSFLNDLFSLNVENQLKLIMTVPGIIAPDDDNYYEDPLTAHAYAEDLISALFENMILIATDIAYQVNQLVTQVENPPDAITVPQYPYRLDTYGAPTYNVPPYNAKEATWTGPLPNNNYAAPHNAKAIAVLSVYFHRHIIPTILDIFQGVFYYIDNANVQFLTTVLNTAINPLTQDVTPNDMALINGKLSLFFNGLLQQLLNFYDTFKFEQPADYTYSDITINPDMQVKWNLIAQSFFIPNTAPFFWGVADISQMQFYFTMEFTHMRELTKLYANYLFDSEQVGTTAGYTSKSLIEMTNKYFVLTDDGFLPDMNVINASPNRLKDYWSVMYRHNLDPSTGYSNPLYYNTMNIMRFVNGVPYTPPAYIDSRFYDHDLTTPVAGDVQYNAYMRTYYNKTNSSQVNTQIILPDFTLPSIDYFRIKHIIFYNPAITISNPPAGSYEVAILTSINLTQALIKNYPTNPSQSLNKPDIFNLTTALNVVNEYMSGFATYYPALGNYIFVISSYATNTGPAPTLSELNSGLIDGLLPAWAAYLDGSGVTNGDYIVPTPPLLPISSPYLYSNLVNNTLEVQNDIMNLTPTTDIIGLFGAMRDNFISQYFYYVKFQNSITNIDSLGFANDQYAYPNMSDLTYELMSEINYNSVDLSPIKDLSTYVYLFPENYPTIIANINLMYLTLDDFSQYIFTTLTEFVTTPMFVTAPRITTKDIADLIYANFNSMQQLTQYLLANTSPSSDLFSNFYQLISSYQPYLSDRDQIMYQIEVYFINNIFTETNPVVTSSDITAIVGIVEPYGIDPVTYRVYFTVIAGQFNSSNRAVQGILINIRVRNDLDYFIIHDLVDSTVSVGTTWKSYIITQVNIMFDPIYLPALNENLELISNEFYPWIFVFLDYCVTNSLAVAGGALINSSTIANPLTLFNQKMFINDTQYINTQYQSFTYLFNVQQYFSDLIWDYTMLLCDQSANQYVQELSGELRWVLSINEIHLTTQSEITAYFQGLANDNALYINEQEEAARTLVQDAARNLYYYTKLVADISSKMRRGAVHGSYTDAGSITSPNKIEDWDVLPGQPIYVPMTDYTYYLINNQERSAIIVFLKEKINESIIVLSGWTKELGVVNENISNIMYRNFQARCAYIRKVGLYLIKSIILRAGDQALDTHTGAWMDIFHELTEQSEKELGYNKMIGNTLDQITFDYNVKGGVTLFIPLIFFFCRNPGMALPLINLMETNMELEIAFAPLSDIAYCEYDAVFLNPGLIARTGGTTVSGDSFGNLNTRLNAYIIGEYVYLEKEERDAFVSRRLQYLFEQTQYDLPTTINDTVVNPVYKVSVSQVYAKEVDEAGRIQTVITNDMANGDYVTANDVNLKYFLKIPYVAYRNVYTTNKLGQRVLNLVQVNPTVNNSQDLTNTQLIHAKRYRKQLKFLHPSEFITMTTQVVRHIDISLRNTQRDYFWGEKQWDNYGLNSYYDLSKIVNTKLAYVKTLSARLSDPNDPTYGFITCIDALIAAYSTQPAVRPSDPIEGWIYDNHDYFLFTLERLKTEYPHITNFTTLNNTIRLKENMIDLNPYFNLEDYDLMTSMVNNIYLNLRFPPPSNATILNAANSVVPGFDPNSFSIDQAQFSKIMIKMLQPEILANETNILAIQGQVFTVYKYYNELQINYIINLIAEFYSIETLDYEVINMIQSFYDIYSVSTNPSSLIMNALLSMLYTLDFTSIEVLNNYNLRRIIYFEWKNIIYQTVPIVSPQGLALDYTYPIPIFVTNIIAKKLNIQLNIILDKEIIQLIDYAPLMVKKDEINPMLRGLIIFNGQNRFFERADWKYWNCVQPYQCALRSPATGINFYSWAMNAFVSQPNGAANLTRVNNFTVEYDFRPEITNNNPAYLMHHVFNSNILNVMGGQCGAQWDTPKAYN